MRKKIIIFLVILLIGGSCFLIARQYHEETHNILGYGTVEARRIYLGSRLGGRISEVKVEEGDTVKANDVLIVLDGREFKAQEAEALAALQSAESNLRELVAGYRPELIEKAEAQVKEQLEYLKKLKAGPLPEEVDAQEARMKSAQADFEHAKKNYERVMMQIRERVTTPQEQDNAERGLNMAQQKFVAEKKNYDLMKLGTRIEDIEIAAARLGQAQAELKRLKAGPTKEEMERARAFIKELEARLQRLRVQLEECVISSPTAGRVEVCDLEAGDILPAGRTAVTMLKPEDLWVKIYIKEFELDRVSLHQKVQVLAETSRHNDFRSASLRLIFSLFQRPTQVKVYQGEIIHIASQAEFTPRNVQTKEERGQQVFAVKAKILNPDIFLRPGISVVVQEEKLE